MTIALLDHRTSAPPAAPVTRHELSALLAEGCREAGTPYYMVLDAMPEATGPLPPILVSNWAYDTIRHVGAEAVMLLAESGVATFLGAPPRGWHPSALAALLERGELALLAGHGHQEVFVFRLQAGARRCFALCSASEAGTADAAALARLQMRICYALARLKAPPVATDPLSDRERECLLWVSQGKTTDEVGLILDVSSNTVNSYVAHAIHKLGASNRAMAIATAIRRNII